MNVDLSFFLTSLLTAGGGGAVVALALFKFWGRSWVENQFAKSLEEFRHVQAKEMAELNAQISGSLSKTLKSQEKEFDALSACWEALNSAYGASLDYAGSMQRFEDLSRSSREQQSELLEHYDLLPTQRLEILDAEDPQAEFIKCVRRIRHNKAVELVQHFANQFYSNEIYVDAKMSDEFRFFVEHFRLVIRSKEAEDLGMVPKPEQSAAYTLTEIILPRIEALVPFIRSKFFQRV